MSSEARPVTNPKVAGLDPVWRPYAGVSLLFDNPGRLPRARGGVRPLTATRAGGAPLLEALVGVSALLGADRLRDAYGVCPLPPPTYHVTICDGVNELQAPGVEPGVARAVSTLLRGLPESIAQLPDSLTFLGAAEVLDAARTNPVSFRAAEIVGWGSVLAVRLAPASSDDESALATIAEARDGLVAAIGAQLGIRVQAWRPHVSLAYFADRTGAAAAEAEIPEWNRMVLESVGDATVRFSSASLYGFTDMVTFFKAA